MQYLCLLSAWIPNLKSLDLGIVPTCIGESRGFSVSNRLGLLESVPKSHGSMSLLKLRESFIMSLGDYRLTKRVMLVVCTCTVSAVHH